MIEWGVMFKSVSFFFLILNIVFIFVEFNEKKGLVKGVQRKQGRRILTAGLIF